MPSSQGLCLQRQILLPPYRVERRFANTDHPPKGRVQCGPVAAADAGDHIARRSSQRRHTHLRGHLIDSPDTAMQRGPVAAAPKRPAFAKPLRQFVNGTANQMIRVVKPKPLIELIQTFAVESDCLGTGCSGQRENVSQNDYPTCLNFPPLTIFCLGYCQKIYEQLRKLLEFKTDHG